MSDRWVRAVRQVHELLEWFTQNELADTGSTGDLEEFGRESGTVVCTDALFALLTMLFWLLPVKVWFE